MDIQRVKTIKAAHEKSLLAKANVVGVGVGLRRGGDEFANQVCIVVSVRRKVPPRQLAPDDRIPDQIDGVPVVVQVTGEIQAF